MLPSCIDLDVEEKERDFVEGCAGKMRHLPFMGRKLVEINQ